MRPRLRETSTRSRRGWGSGSNVSRITAKEHALGPHTRPRKSRNGNARTDAAKAQTREAIAEVLPAATHRPRVRDARSSRARHDAEDDRVRVRDLDQHGRQHRGERVQEAWRPRRRGRRARAPGRALLLRDSRRLWAYPRAPQGKPLGPRGCLMIQACGRKRSPARARWLQDWAYVCPPSSNHARIDSRLSLSQIILQG